MKPQNFVRSDLHFSFFLHRNPLVHPAFALHRRRIFGTGEARNVKFGIQTIDLGKSHLMGDEIPAKGAWSWPRGRIVKF